MKGVCSSTNNLMTISVSKSKNMYTPLLLHKMRFFPKRKFMILFLNIESDAIDDLGVSEKKVRNSYVNIVDLVCLKLLKDKGLFLKCCLV